MRAIFGPVDHCAYPCLWMKRAYRWNAVAGPAHGARLAAVGAPALAPHAPLGPVARRHVAGALLLLVGHGTPEAAVILLTSFEFKNRDTEYSYILGYFVCYNPKYFQP